MKVVEINGSSYDVVVNENDAIDVELLRERVTDYFKDYDYIFGDWSYGKVRLKGYYDGKNPKCKKINDVRTYEEYLKKYCSYGCRYFLIKRV